MDDSHAPFDVRFRRESPPSLAHGLERSPVLDSCWLAWGTSYPGARILSGRRFLVGGCSSMCETDDSTHNKVHRKCRQLWLCRPKGPLVPLESRLIRSGRVPHFGVPSHSGCSPQSAVTIRSLARTSSGRAIPSLIAWRCRVHSRSPGRRTRSTPSAAGAAWISSIRAWMR